MQVESLTQKRLADEVVSFLTDYGLTWNQSAAVLSAAMAQVYDTLRHVDGKICTKEEYIRVMTDIVSLYIDGQINRNKTVA